MLKNTNILERVSFFGQYHNHSEKFRHQFQLKLCYYLVLIEKPKLSWIKIFSTYCFAKVSDLCQNTTHHNYV
jgi:hypothetical protein